MILIYYNNPGCGRIKMEITEAFKSFSDYIARRVRQKKFSLLLSSRVDSSPFGGSSAVAL
jgi:hypothetical protein